MSTIFALSPVDDVRVELVSDGQVVSAADSPAPELLLFPIVVGGGGTGASETITATAGSVIQSRRVVRADSAGLIWPVDTSIDAHASQIVGVSVSSASVAGQAVIVQRFGIATEGLWAWQPGEVFSGPSGELTQSPSATGWLAQVARVLSATSIDIDIEPAIIRS